MTTFVISNEKKHESELRFLSQWICWCIKSSLFLNKTTLIIRLDKMGNKWSKCRNLWLKQQTTQPFACHNVFLCFFKFSIYFSSWFVNDECALQQHMHQKSWLFCVVVFASATLYTAPRVTRLHASGLKKRFIVTAQLFPRYQLLFLSTCKLKTVKRGYLSEWNMQSFSSTRITGIFV